MSNTEVEKDARITVATALSTMALIVAAFALVVALAVLCTSCKSFNMPDNWHNPLSVEAEK